MELKCISIQALLRQRQKVLSGRETSERSFLQEVYYVIKFSCFLGDKIGLITSGKNIVFVPYHDFYLKSPTSFPQKSEDQQGCALAEPGGPWHLTFALGRLEKLGTLDLTVSEHRAPFSFPQSTALISNNAGERDGKPDPSAILSFSCTDEAISIF